MCINRVVSIFITIDIQIHNMFFNSYLIVIKQCLISFIIFSFLVVIVHVIPHQTYAATITLNAVSDTMVLNANPNTNYGSTTSLETQNTLSTSGLIDYVFTKFDVSALNNATITSVVLHIYMDDTTNGAHNFYTMNSGW